MSNKLFNRQYILGVLILLGVNIGNSMLVAPLAIYGKGLTNSDVYAGLLTTVFAFSALASRFIVSIMFKFLTNKTILFSGIILTLLSALGYLCFSNTTIIILLRVVAGLGFGISTTASLTIISNSLTQEYLLKGIAYSGIASAASYGIGPVLALYLCHNQFEFFNRVFIALLVLVLMYLFLAIFVKNNAKSKDSQVKESKSSSKFINFVIIISVVSFMLATLAQSSISTFLSVFAIQKNMGNISAFFAIFAIVAVLSKFIMPKLVSAMGEKKLIILCLVLTCASIVAIAFNNKITVLFLLAIPYAFCCGILEPMFNVRILREVTLEQQGSANAMFYVSMDIGMGAGALVWGLVASNIGYSLMYVAAGVVALSAGILFMLTNKK